MLLAFVHVPLDKQQFGVSEKNSNMWLMHFPLKSEQALQIGFTVETNKQL